MATDSMPCDVVPASLPNRIALELDLSSLAHTVPLTPAPPATIRAPVRFDTLGVILDNVTVPLDVTLTISTTSRLSFTTIVPFTLNAIIAPLNSVHLFIRAWVNIPL